MTLRAVLFDLGGTLFSYGALREPFDVMLRELAADHAIDAPMEQIRQAYREAMAGAMSAYHGRPYYLHREMFAAAHRELLDRFGAQARDHDLLYERQRDVGLDAVSPRPGVEATIRALRERGLHLGIVSNIDDDQFAPLWERMGLGALFHATTTSEEARSCKPDPGIYHHALAKAEGVRAEEVLFMGDSAPHDVLGAKRLGMLTALIGRAPAQADPSLEPDHRIREIPELLEIVPR